MIAAAVTGIALQLNQSLRRTFKIAEDLVVVSNLTEPDGNMVSQVSNKLALFLVNIEKDGMPYRASQATAGGFGRGGISHAPVHLNLLLLFAATFSGTNYPESLKFISHTIGFFQSRPVFDHQNTPELDSRIDKLMLDIENLSIADLSNLWGILSGKYMPSVMYRVRVVTIDSGQLIGQAPYVVQPQAGVSA
jgi:uncharacterized protein DUF4255